ncbi:hypothetical protein ACOMHN_035543 [Nucella lapillus]
MSAHASSSSDVSGAESDRSDNDSVPAVIPGPECPDLLVPICKYQKSWRPIIDLPFVLFWSNRDFAKHPSKQAADEVKHCIEVEFGAHKTIYEVDTESENYQIFIVTGDKYEKYLFLDLEQMRLDIAKALGQKQRALQITVGKQALEDVKNLQEQLCSATNISINVHSRRALTFIIKRYPSHTTTKTTLHFHSSDTIQDVKSELSALMRVPEHRVDLTYPGQTLTDEKTIRSCEIQTGKEYIYVDVYDNRVLLKLHLLGSKKSPVTVISEDIEKTTVRDLKRFCKNVVPAYSSLCDFEMLVILQNRTLSDSQTLSLAGVSGGDKLQQIIVKGCKSLCFSATSTMQDGEFIIFQGRDDHSSFNMFYTIEKKAWLFTDSMEESETEGAMELKRTISTSVHISDHGAAGAHMALMESGTSASSLVDFTGDCHMSQPRHVSLDEQTMWDNAKFKYIDRKIILAVASQLGKDGIPVIIQLGVPQTKIDEVEAKRGSCSNACNLECLITWCKMHGEKANPDTLKEVLANNDRNDLVVVVNDILSEKTGYNTC